MIMLASDICMDFPMNKLTSTGNVKGTITELRTTITNTKVVSTPSLSAKKGETTPVEMPLKSKAANAYCGAIRLNRK